MVSQHHKIRRQVLEVSGCSAAEAPRLQALLREIYYQRLLPAIDQACSDASAPGRVDRIERLEIHLEPASIERLDVSWAEAFDRTFAPALARGLADAADDGEPAVLRSHLELFSYFVRTGTVPWWADRSDPALLDTALLLLVQRAPAALLQQIDAVPDRRAAWRRIVRAHSDAALDALARLRVRSTATTRAGGDLEWLRLVSTAAAAQGIPAATVRLVWWEARLGIPATGEPDRRASPAVGEVLPRLAERLELSYPALIAALRHPRDGNAAPSWVRDVLDPLVAAGTAHEADGVAAARAALTSLLSGIDTTDGPSASDWADAQALLARLPARERSSMQARLSAALRLPIPGNRSAERAADIARKPSDRADGFALDDDAECSDLAESPTPSATDRGARVLDASSSRPRSRSSRPDGVDLRFSDVDAIEVDNAGLVILWPFLERFFMHLDLVRGKAFVAETARHRAVGLLQYVATENSAGPEFLLPLNKVLCGMTPETVFDFGAPITPSEMTAVSDLLAAVVENAPVLRRMSASGFRGSFLLRHGQLSARDGHFLLRVARETHDIVLDKFPWSSSIVKLPWMTALMQVEW